MRQTRTSFSGGRILTWYTTGLKQTVYSRAHALRFFLTTNRIFSIDNLIRAHVLQDTC